MNINKLNKIDTLSLDIDKIIDYINSVSGIIVKIDEINSRFNAENRKNQLYKAIEDRIYRYVLEIAEENKTKKEEEIKKFFYERVDSIFEFSMNLSQKDMKINIEDIHKLHKTINPNWCWDKLEDKTWRIIRKFTTSWEFRKEERFTDDFWWKKYYYEDIENIEKYINILLDWYNTENEIPEIIKILIFGIYFINIHPYSNSNWTVVFILFGILCLKSWYFISEAIYQYFNSEIAIRDIRKLKNNWDISDYIGNSLNAFLYYSEK